MIDCGNHGRVAGYVVCTHVMAGEPVELFDEATFDHPDEPHLDLGEALCRACAMDRASPGPPDTDVLKLVCAYCLTKFPHIPAVLPPGVITH